VDIAAWLHGLGLQQYEPAFCDNAIDVAVLPELTADDLKDLGVRLVGHRRNALQTRIGIATGLVVVGDLVEGGDGQEHEVVGETPNLAARLQALAEPNTVVVAPSTRQLVGNLSRAAQRR
jgi:class 3 adenylate cyclase